MLPAFPYILLSSTFVAVIGLASQPLAHVAGYFAWLGLSYMIAMVRLMAAVPFASLEVRRFDMEMCAASYVLLAALCWLLSRRRPGGGALRRLWRPVGRVLAVPARPLGGVPAAWLATGLALPALLTWMAVLSSPDSRLAGVFAAPDGRLTVEVFDVGQGDAIFIRTPDGQKLLVDGGPDGQVIEQELGEALPFWDRKLDMVLLTHPDSDHLSGLLSVVERYDVERVAAAPIDADTGLAAAWQDLVDEKGVPYEEVAAGGWIDLGRGASLQILGPPEQPVTGTSADRNNNSLVLRLTWGRRQLPPHRRHRGGGRSGPPRRTRRPAGDGAQGGAPRLRLLDEPGAPRCRAAGGVGHLRRRGQRLRSSGAVHPRTPRRHDRLPDGPAGRRDVLDRRRTAVGQRRTRLAAAALALLNAASRVLYSRCPRFPHRPKGAGMERADGRRPDQLRPVRIVPGYLPHAEGSALIEQGGTVVLCAVSVEDRLPPFLRDKGGGWVTAEYGMLPRSTHTRSPREAAQGRVGGRTHEIQRLIGRALRAVTRLDILGERTFTVDCDVIQADAGTRCAAITGAYVALRQACDTLLARHTLSTMPLSRRPGRRERRHRRGRAAARPDVRGGLARGGRLQRRYDRIGRVRRGAGLGGERAFPRATLDEVLRLAGQGIRELLEAQSRALASLQQPQAGD